MPRDDAEMLGPISTGCVADKSHTLRHRRLHAEPALFGDAAPSCRTMIESLFESRITCTLRVFWCSSLDAWQWGPSRAAVMRSRARAPRARADKGEARPTRRAAAKVGRARPRAPEAAQVREMRVPVAQVP